MSKLRVLLVGATAAGAFAAASFLPAFAEEPAGQVPDLADIYATGDTDGGHIVVQGTSDDVPAVGHGYIGIQSDGESAEIVGCANGDYTDEETPANVIVNIPGDINPAFDPTPGEGPCTPAPPAAE